LMSGGKDSVTYAIRTLTGLPAKAQEIYAAP
jgi:hypothetical protein